MENLPNNWVLAYLYEVIQAVKTGVREFYDLKYYYSTGSIKENEFTIEGEFNFENRPSRANREVNEFDVLQARMENTDKAVLIDENLKGSLFSTGFMHLRPYGNTINSKYLYYFVKSSYFNTQKNELASGTTQVAINDANAKKILTPLPPLAEQQRIVAKLDGLFRHLDSLKQRLELIPTLLKQFRQSVLTQAVTGKLTEEWRGSKSVVIDSPITIGDEFQEKPKNWIWCNLIDIAKLESGHTPRKSKEEYWINGDVPWISLQDIRAAHGTIITDTKYKPNMVGINNSSARLLPKGTVCFSRDISVGYTTIMGKEMATTQHFANWICREKLFNKYLLYAFISAKDFLIASGRGTTVKTIYMPALKQFRLLRPPIEEQTEIVKRVESLFVKADTIEAAYDKLKQQIDNLPQAILAKAFKGELVAQLPTDGDARDLLKEIATLRASLEKEKKSKKKKKVTVK